MARARDARLRAAPARAVRGARQRAQPRRPHAPVRALADLLPESPHNHSACSPVVM